MTTQNKHTPLTGEVVSKSEEKEETPGGRELSIRRYLFPALLEEKRDNRWWTRQLLALMFTVLLVVGILVLYIYGANLAV